MAPTLAIAFTRQFAFIAGLATLAALFSAPLIPLIDSAVLDLVEGTSHSFGSLRAWGTPGFILMVFGAGYLLTYTGLAALFYIYAALFALAGIAAWWLPARRHKMETGAFGRGLGQLLRQPSLVLFLISAFLGGIAFTGYTTFFGVVLQDRGASLIMISLANIIAAVSEFPMLLFSAVVLRRLGNRGTLIMGFAVYAFRWGVMALTRLPLVALLTQGLHGVSWAPVMLGSVAYVKTHSPRGLEATGQSLLSASAAGVGAVTGALGSGWLYDHLGAGWLFIAMALCCGVALLLLLPADGRQPGMANGA
jgi:PPP family 3-phenylpropionic acid transporter